MIAAFVLSVSSDTNAQAAVEQVFTTIADNAATTHAEFLALRDFVVHLRYVAAAVKHIDQLAARIHRLLANIQRWSYETDAALASYQAALELYRAVGDRLGEANVRQAMGDVQQFRKEMDTALASYQAALELYRAVGDRLGEANTLASQGRLALISDDQFTAETLLQ